MKQELFEHYLNIYGSSVDQWPEPVASEALRALSHSAFLRELLQQEIQLERHLRTAAEVSVPSSLAERIIAQNTVRKVPVPMSLTLGEWLSRLFVEFYMPRPAFAIASLLLLGMVTGFTIPADDTIEDEDSYTAFTDDLYYESEGV